MSRGLFFAAAAALTVASSLTAASAVPAAIGASLQPSDAAITKVQYYGGDVYSSPLELPGAVIGGALSFLAGGPSNGYYAPSSGYDAQPYGQYGGAPYGGAPYGGGSLDDRMDACAARYYSFDPTSGTYTTYEGYQVLCPYLR